MSSATQQVLGVLAVCRAAAVTRTQETHAPPPVFKLLSLQWQLQDQDLSQGFQNCAAETPGELVNTPR